MSKNSAGFAEIESNNVLAEMVPGVRFEAIAVPKVGPNPSDPTSAPAPYASVKELTAHGLLTFFVTLNFGRIEDAFESLILAAGKLYQRATGQKRGPVPENVDARMRRSFRMAVPEGSARERALLQAYEFLILAYKAKQPPTQVTVVASFNDGTQGTFKLTAKDAENAANILNPLESAGARFAAVTGQGKNRVEEDFDNAASMIAALFIQKEVEPSESEEIESEPEIIPAARLVA